MGVIYCSVGWPSVGVWNPTVVDGFAVQLGGTSVGATRLIKIIKPIVVDLKLDLILLCCNSFDYLLSGMHSCLYNVIYV